MLGDKITVSGLSHESPHVLNRFDKFERGTNASSDTYENTHV